MSSISGMSPNFGMEALAAVMTKKANDQHGQAALSLIQAAAQSSQQVQAASGTAGGHINIKV